jgi:tetratricopeptide (TPR) repeat protein
MITQTLQHIRDALSREDPEQALASIFAELMSLSLTRSRRSFESEDFSAAIYESTHYLLLAEKHAPDNREDHCLAYCIRGKARYHNKDFENAIEDLTKTRALFENTTEDEQVEVHIYLGNAYLKRGCPETAIATFQKVLKRRPDDPTLLYNFATACLEMGDSLQASQQACEPAVPNPWYQESIEAFTKAISKTENVENFYNRGCAYFKAHQFKEAEADFGRAIACNGNEARFHYNRAMARTRLGRRDAQDDLATYQFLSGDPSPPHENGELR